MAPRNARTLSQYSKRHKGDADWLFKEMLLCLSGRELLGMVQLQSYLSQCNECDRDCKNGTCSSRISAERRIKLCHREISRRKITLRLSRSLVISAKSHDGDYTPDSPESDD